MAIPDFQTLMLPLLESISDGKIWRMSEVTFQLAKRFQLSDQELKIMLPSGQAPLFANRVAWAKTHLKAAGLIENSLRGSISISKRGISVLGTNPAIINIKFLKHFDEYTKFSSSKKPGPNDSAPAAAELDSMQAKPPLEHLEEAFGILQTALKDELLTRLKNGSPAFFERVVLKLLSAMGFGVSGRAQLTGQAGDGGIDGVIHEDKLGLDIVCIQAKRYGEIPVGRPTIQQFSGSMDGHKAKKGVILTTSSFSKEAVAFVDRIEGKRVVLIGGDQLVNLMLEHNVGVTTERIYEVKTVSGDFFSEDE